MPPALRGLCEAVMVIGASCKYWFAAFNIRCRSRRRHKRSLLRRDRPAGNRAKRTETNLTISASINPPLTIRLPPSDVRKSLSFRQLEEELIGAVPPASTGRSPLNKKWLPGRSETFRTSSGRAASLIPTARTSQQIHHRFAYPSLTGRLV